MEYKKIEKIGDPSGFGDVYKCCIENEELKENDEIYAIKVLKRIDESSFERFKKEIRILIAMNHPRIIKVLDYSFTEDNPFYVMPLYKCSLKNELDNIKNDYGRIRIIFNSIFDGVEYLHNQGIYHRDLKPDNVLMNSDTDLVITDLGLSLDINSNTPRMTETGMRMGTLFYASPEQLIDSKHVDHRTDIYSLGKMIYVCLGGRIVIGDINLDDIPQGLRHVVSKCTRTNREDRFQNIAELRKVFNSSIDLLMSNVNMNDLKNIINRIIAENDTSLVPNLIDYLEVVDNLDEDLVNEIIMDLPLDIIVEINNKDGDLFIKIIDIFVDYITSQQWGFDYTDIIGDKCKEIYYSIDNTKVKAKLLYGVGEVAIWHNRWHVMDIFDNMIKKIDNADLAYEGIQEMEKINRKSYLNKFKDDFKVNNIIRDWIKSLFE